jgi:hypothetical protein
MGVRPYLGVLLLMVAYLLVVCPLMVALLLMEAYLLVVCPLMGARPYLGVLLLMVAYLLVVCPLMVALLLQWQIEGRFWWRTYQIHRLVRFYWQMILVGQMTILLFPELPLL